MSSLERRYARLLCAYPATYRAERGDEMLDTLMEAAPSGRRRPSARDAGALIMGGLRVRAAQNRRLSAPTNLRLAAAFAAALIIALESASVTNLA